MSAAKLVSGTERIAEAFARAQADGRRAALMPYLMGGFPDLSTSRRIARAYVEGGADLIELGVPFSDPLADGPVIHRAATVALQAGATVESVLELGRDIGQDVPVVVMCYSNPIFARGIERFLDALLSASISGLIVPDLPAEEAAEWREQCDRAGVALVPLVAPTTPEDRLGVIGAQARGFVYCVSLIGTTGEREGVESRLGAMVERTKARTEVPVAVGFGIGTPEQARQAVESGADGVIVGSRLVREAGEADDPPAAVGDLMRSFARALS